MRIMRALALITLLLCVMSCTREKSKILIPGGYKVWVMNADEIYLADPSDELIFGPSLREIGLTKSHIVALCVAPGARYAGTLNTDGYNIVDLKSGKISLKLSTTDVEAALMKSGERMPEMKSYDDYLIAAQ